MPAAALAIPFAIQAGTSVLGGVLGSRAAKKSADIQSQAAQEQATGFRTALDQWNPQIGQRADLAAEEVRGAAGQGANLAMDLGREAQQGLQPYTQLGGETARTLSEFMAPGGAGMQTFTADQMEQFDPGYQFRLSEAQKALEKSAAARGGLLGGGTAKALARQQQNLASSEFGAAEARFRAQQQDRFSRLFGTTQLGSQAATQAGQFGTNAAQYAGDLGYRGAATAGELGFRGTQLQAGNALSTQQMIAEMMTDSARAKAGGVMGSANAWGGALGGVGQAAQGVGNYYQDKSLLSQWMNPALQTPGAWTPPTAPALGLPSTIMPGAPPAAPWQSPTYGLPDWLK